MSSVFISYRHVSPDDAFAAALHKKLLAAGVESEKTLNEALALALEGFALPDSLDFC